MLIDMVIEVVGGGDKVEGYGKVVIVGVNGEVEYGLVLIYMFWFGNFYCEVVGVKFYLVFINICGLVNVLFQILLMDKNDGGCCSYYLII